MNRCRVPLFAALLLVALRLCIGWQFLYEGLWKVNTLGSLTPWTSEGYLKTAQGPLRDYFRAMAGDPDDLGWLDYAHVSKRWYNWRDQFVAHYHLTAEQTRALDRLLDGSAEQDSPADQLPPTPTLWQPLLQLPASVDLKSMGKVVRYDADKKQLVIDGPLLPLEERQLLLMVDVAEQGKSYSKRTDPKADPDPVELEFYKAVQNVAKQSRNLSLRHKLAGSLRGNPENVGVTAELNPQGTYDVVMGTPSGDADDEGKRHVLRYGKIQEYKDLLKDYNSAVKNASIDYQVDHAERLAKKAAIMRAELAGPIKSMDVSLRTSAINLLTPDQLALPPLPSENARLAKSDQQVIWGLLILGVLLIAGLFTRGAAILGAVMLLMFYMVTPPWPGVPPAPGPEHSLFVNKNLIEAIALLAIAALPTGSWFGIDALFSAMWRRLRRKPVAARP